MKGNLKMSKKLMGMFSTVALMLALAVPSFSQTLINITTVPPGIIYMGDSDSTAVQVIAHYNDGSQADVTASATITNDPNNPNALTLIPQSNGPTTVTKNATAPDAYQPAPVRNCGVLVMDHSTV